jgi:hypothetical protein
VRAAESTLPNSGQLSSEQTGVGQILHAAPQFRQQRSRVAVNVISQSGNRIERLKSSSIPFMTPTEQHNRARKEEKRSNSDDRNFLSPAMLQMQRF